MSEYSNWIGKKRTIQAFLDPWRAQALAATLDIAEPVNNELPGLWHWLYFVGAVPATEIGPDGHPKKGGFMPPVVNPRRMFAGAKTTYHAPVMLGQPAELTETIRDIQHKTGGSGELVIVTVAFDYSQNGQLCIEEQRNIIYLPASTQRQEKIDRFNPVPDAFWQSEFSADIIRLFRFSALTFNSHRIHYDRDYAQNEELYPELVVHGPMTAIMLSEILRNQNLDVTQFSFRAKAPLFAGQTVRLRGQSDDSRVELNAYTPSGTVAMQATAEVK